jgi:hypothetical protein
MGIIKRKNKFKNMKTIFYIVGRLFFSKEKILLIRLLNQIQDTLIRYEDGTVTMRKGGMCLYISDVVKNMKDYSKLKLLIYNHKPKKVEEGLGYYYFEPFNYELRYEFLKDLIKKY